MEINALVKSSLNWDPKLFPVEIDVLRFRFVSSVLMIQNIKIYETILEWMMVHSGRKLGIFYV